MSLHKEYEIMIEKLRSGELGQYLVTKVDFPVFREVLVKQADKEKIRGEAQKGGEVIYTYDHS